MGKPKKLAIPGKRYGNITVIRFEGTDELSHSLWLCKCDCGKIYVRPAHNIEKMMSCGCLKTLPDGVASMHHLYASYKYVARKRKYSFELSIEDFKRLTLENCNYCGIAPSTVHKPKRLNGAYTYNGIDRVTNTMGYTPENCVSCCVFCNKAKNDMTMPEWNAWLDRIVNMRKKAA